jgi:hypothetical protein
MTKESVIQNLKNKFQILGEKIQQSSPENMMKLFKQQQKVFDVLLKAQTHKA